MLDVAFSLPPLVVGILLSLPSLVLCCAIQQLTYQDATQGKDPDKHG